MDRSDTAAILPEDVLSRQTEGESDSDWACQRSEDEKVGGARCPHAGSAPFACPLGVTVEPVTFLCYFAFALQQPLFTQYLWERISQEVGYNGTKERGCGNSSGPTDALAKEVETLIAHWSLYISLGSFLVGLVSLPLLGSWSDHAGRRKLLIICSLGLALQAAINLMVVYFRLHIAWFFLGRTVSSMTGDLNAMVVCCYAYIVDVSDIRSRTFRLAVMETMQGLAGALASVIQGPWLRTAGFISPFCVALLCDLAAALYTCLFVLESVTPDPQAQLFTLKHHRAVLRLYSSSERCRHRAWLWLYTFSMLVVVMVHFGTHNLYVLYELSPPLCWGPDLIGFGSAALFLAYVTSLLGLRIMQYCLDDSWIVIMGLVSNMAGLVVMSLANTTALMFTGYGLLFLYLIPTPVIRSKMSKLVSTSEQGVLFAAVACVLGMSSMVSNSLFNSLYPAMLDIMKGLPFLLAAGLLLIPVAIIWAVWCQERRAEGNQPTEAQLSQE